MMPWRRIGDLEKIDHACERINMYSRPFYFCFIDILSPRQPSALTAKKKAASGRLALAGWP
jgi:hypothetical protein